MDKEIFIAFATQKGGIGKTTLTVLTASYLHYVKGYNVAVVDCDAPQNSIADLRAREIKVINESTYFKALACDHFRRVKKKAYPVVTSNAADALDDADKMLREEATKPISFFSTCRARSKARVSSRRSRRWITSSPRSVPTASWWKARCSSPPCSMRT
jgi:cellulose biosynthesis protein BcsQ